ncbi:M50 family metallopeptidase [Alkalihalobacillus deserti]|uniref:M50 family metallopeptidase n=1 Tax=Alkalihalobacillus deserti TaxID=2879466 RepID=UPI001D13821D|nr:M50 family metallopeptidase [Alkalihalobacillus deserti]
MDFMYAYIAIAIIISFIPRVRPFFFIIYTLIHETGHALAALLTSGKVYCISLYASTDGVAHTGSKSWFSSVIVAYAGYTFSSLIAILAFFLIANGESTFLFYVLFTIALINLLLWVRNKFGIFWLLIYIGGSYLLIHYQLTSVKEMIVYLLASIILVQSVLASLTILILSLTNSKQAGDAQALQKLTFIPAFVWGSIFFLQSLLSTYFVFIYFI